MPEFQVNWHHELIGEYLDKWQRKEIKRLIINMPPRHGKTELASRRLIAKIIGDDPNARVMSCSFGAELAYSINDDVKDIVESDEYKAIYGTRISPKGSGGKRRRMNFFQVPNAKGYVLSAGAGGGIVGRGFDYGIIDDPHKNRQEANSPTLRDTIWGWYAGAFSKRKQKDACVLVIQTRWHDEDLSGLLINKMEMGGEQWTILSLPAIAKQERHPDDPRDVGEALWPDEFPIEALRAEEQIDKFEFAAQYQQEPPSQMGTLFDVGQIEYVNSDPGVVKKMRFWDLATTEKETADFTAGLLLGKTFDNEPVVYHLWHKQAEIPDVVEGIYQCALSDGKDIPIRLEGEKAGIIALSYIRRDERFNGYDIRLQTPKGSKRTRAGSIATQVNTGHMMVLKAAWNNAFTYELSVFTGDGKGHDDIVDALSGAWNEFTERRSYQAETQRY